MLQQEIDRSTNIGNEFGDLLYRWRGRVSREKVRKHLPGWSKDTLYRIERGETAPPFELLFPLFRALCQAGVVIPADDIQIYLRYAREKIEGKKTRHEHPSDEKWAELSDDLIRIYREFCLHGQSTVLNPSNPLLIDTSHLIKRDEWHKKISSQLDGPGRKKVIVVAGPFGIGKTSELNHLALELRRTNSHRPIKCDFYSVEGPLEPEEALDIFLGTMLSALGHAQPQTASLEDTVQVLLELNEKSLLPVVMIIDHGEYMLNGHGQLAACWERFLTKFLKYRHRATLIIGIRQWPTWFSGDLRFLAETPVPPLRQEQGVALLQQLGLETLPTTLLQEVCERVGGQPIYFEWFATLAQQLASVGDSQQQGERYQEAEKPSLVDVVRRLLAEPYIFGGTLSSEIAPLLERILSNYHFSIGAQMLLQNVALATLPLANVALDVICPEWSGVIGELRRSALLVAYPDRVQVLPGVASAVVRKMPHQMRRSQEELLIGAYIAWLKDGEFYENEKAAIITELVTLQLAHHQLLPAAQILIRYGWLSFHMGHTVRLARLARTAIEQWGQQGSHDLDGECGKCLLRYFMGPYLGEKINVEARVVDYERLLGRIIDRSIAVQPHTELFIVRHLAVHCMNRKRYLDAQALVVACEQRLASSITGDPDLHTAVLEKWGILYTSWCEYEVKQGNEAVALSIREKAVATYQESQRLLIQAEMYTTPLKRSLLKKRLARALTNLGFHLSRVGRFEEAAEVLQESVHIKEQGYTEPGSLAASYGDLSQALLGMGSLSEAERFDRLAWEEIHRMAASGDTLSQENTWIYYVNRGRLYIALGHLDEADRLLLGALENLHERWDMYRTFASEALEEIKQRRASVLEEKL